MRLISVGPGKDFENLESAVAAIPSSLTEPYILELYTKTWTYNPTSGGAIQVSKTTSASNNITIRNAIGETPVFNVGAVVVDGTMLAIRCNYVTVEGLKFTVPNDYYGVILVNVTKGGSPGPVGCIIRNNVIQFGNMTTASNGQSWTGISGYYATNLLIEGNTITTGINLSNSQYSFAIYTLYCSGWFLKNTITGDFYWAIQDLHNDNIEVAFNTITGLGHQYISYSIYQPNASSLHKIHHNIFKNAYGYNIYPRCDDAGSTTATIKLNNNVVDVSPNHAIRFLATSYGIFEIKNNEITNASNGLVLPTGGSFTVTHKYNCYFGNTYNVVNGSLDATEFIADPKHLGRTFTYPADPYSFWHYNNGYGTVLKDTSGVANHGTMHSVAWLGAGINGFAISLSGNGSYIDGFTKLLPPVGTMSLWIKRNGAPGGTGELVFSHFTATGRVYVYLTSIGYLQCFLGDGATSTIKADNMCDNVWHHVVFQWGKRTTQARAWFDGSPINIDGGGDNFDTNNAYTFGRLTSQGTLAKLDEIGIYDRWLTDSEVAGLYGVDGGYHLAPWSPCIDTGDPTFDFSLEPNPHGTAINIGRYGGTSEAAISRRVCYVGKGGTPVWPYDTPASAANSLPWLLDVLRTTYTLVTMPVQIIFIDQETYTENYDNAWIGWDVEILPEWGRPTIGRLNVTGSTGTGGICIHGFKMTGHLRFGGTTSGAVKIYDMDIIGDFATANTDLAAALRIELSTGGISIKNVLIKHTGGPITVESHMGLWCQQPATIENVTLDGGGYIGYGWVQGSGGGVVVLKNCIIQNFPRTALNNSFNWAVTSKYNTIFNCGNDYGYSSESYPDMIQNRVEDAVANPLFVNPATNDYHLQSESPCIATGDPSSDTSKQPWGSTTRIERGRYGNTPEATFDTSAPANVLTLNASVLANNKDVRLAWNNPASDFSGVAIRKRYDKFPTYKDDGVYVLDKKFYKLHFNGINTQVDFGNHTAHDLSGKNFSISLWFRTNKDYVLGKGVLLNRRVAFADAGYQLFIFTNNMIYFSYYFGGGNPWPEVRNYTALNDGNWHHVCVTWKFGAYTSADRRIYIDGVYAAGGTVSQNGLDSSSSLIAGRELAVTSWFEGDMSDVHIFNKFLPQAEVTNLYNLGVVPDGSLFGRWNLDEGSGSVAVDSSMYAFNGAIANGDWNTGTNTRGRYFDDSLAFDGNAVAYYSAFSYDDVGNYSSGTSASAVNPWAVNVSHVNTANNGIDSVTINWVDNYGMDGYVVRRKTDGYPEDETDGYLAYEGTDRTFEDKVLPGIKYYYGIFSFMNNITPPPARYYSSGIFVNSRVGSFGSVQAQHFGKKLKNLVPSHYLEE